MSLELSICEKTCLTVKTTGINGCLYPREASKKKMVVTLCL